MFRRWAAPRERRRAEMLCPARSNIQRHHTGAVRGELHLGAGLNPSEEASDDNRLYEIQSGV